MLQAVLTNALNNINLPEVVGKGYATFWHARQRYVAVKGGRSSKKSKTAALRWIYMLEKMPLANLLVIRRYKNTHKDSTFAELVWAIKRLGLAGNWIIPQGQNPMLELTHRKTGQKILFRGMDEPDSITSITVQVGHLCWCWCEEAFQITNEADFIKLDGSIRGNLPDGYFHQFVLTFNPWSDKIWIKAALFDQDTDNGYPVLALTTTYLCNEFDKDAHIRYEYMRIHSPRRYHIEGAGNWGISEGLVFENWVEQEFDWDAMLKERKSYYSDAFKYKALFGLDFGYTNDPTAFVGCLVDAEKKILYLGKELYKPRLSNQGIADNINYLGFGKERILADSSDPRTIDELKKLGLTRINGAKKGKGSVEAGIQALQDYKIVIHPRCTNAIVEFSNYVYDVDKFGKTTNKPIDEYNHIIDALRYATTQIHGGAISFD